MNPHTEIILYSFGLLQLLLSVLILWMSSSKGKAVPTADDLVASDSEKVFMANCRKYQLTSREAEVVKLVGQGLPYKLIACQLNVSDHTVNTHVKNMFAKVGVTNKMELVGRMMVQYA